MDMGWILIHIFLPKSPSLRDSSHDRSLCKPMRSSNSASPAEKGYSCNSLKSQALAEDYTCHQQTDLSSLMSFSPSLGRPTSNARSPLTRQAAVPVGQERTSGLVARSTSVKCVTLNQRMCQV